MHIILAAALWALVRMIAYCGPHTASSVFLIVCHAMYVARNNFSLI